MVSASRGSAIFLTGLLGCAVLLASTVDASGEPAAPGVGSPVQSLSGLARASSGETAPPGANDFACKPGAEHPNPVVLVHAFGLNAASNWQYLSPRIKSAGYCVFALTYGQDPRAEGLPYSPGGLIPIEQSAAQLASFVERVLKETGARRVDLVGHSLGTVMPRYYLERLGGKEKVQRFVALAPAWRGSDVDGGALRRDLLGDNGQPLDDLYAAFCGSCHQSQRGSAFLNDLNADGEAVPGITHTNIVTRYDELVIPYTSGIMRDGGTNLVLQDICPLDASEHALVAFDPVVARLVLRALDSRNAKRVGC